MHLQENTMNKNIIMNWLKTTSVSLTDISKKTGISRNTLHVWINGGTPRQRNLDKLVDAYSNNINRESKLLLRGGQLQMTKSNMDYENDINHDQFISSSYVIQLQKDKIAQQEKELAELKAHIERQPLQKMKFDEVQADMQTTVEMKNIFNTQPTERRILNIQGAHHLSDRLNIPKDVMINKYFDQGNWHKFDEHPIVELICKKTKSELDKMRKLLPTVLESLKWVAGLHYMIVPVRYINGEHTCNTICYVVLDWKSKPVSVSSKTVILNGSA